MRRSHPGAARALAVLPRTAIQTIIIASTPPAPRLCHHLAQRVHQHREGHTPGFASRYRCHLLVFHEYYERMDDAIACEKQIKGGSRANKMPLIEASNPQWRDLYGDLA